MNSTLLQLAFNLLMTTAASIGQPPSPSSALPYAAATPHEQSAQVASPIEQRRQARAARVSLLDPYYSFSRAKRVASKD